jgi:hypothetical protein
LTRAASPGYQNTLSRRIPAARYLYHRDFLPCLEAAGLRHITLHGLRHSFASILIESGVPLAYVKEQLGHSSIRVTVDTYAYFIPSRNIEWIDSLDSSGRRDIWPMPWSVWRKTPPQLAPGVAPQFPRFPTRWVKSLKAWSRREESNLRPTVYETVSRLPSYVGSASYSLPELASRA